MIRVPYFPGGGSPCSHGGEVKPPPRERRRPDEASGSTLGECRSQAHRSSDPTEALRPAVVNGVARAPRRNSMECIMPKATKSERSAGATASEAAEQLLRLFPCSRRSFATWDPQTVALNDDGKLVPKYVTERRPITATDWDEHLAGRRAAVVPLACDDGTTQVTIVDIDYVVDLVALAKKVRLLGLPLYLSKSKSGCPHLTAFHNAPIGVADSERLGQELVRRLGLSGGPVEIFPRPQREGKLGHDVNMPYFGNQRGYLRPDASEELPLAEFLATVERMTAEQRAPLLTTAPGDDAGRGQSFAELMLARYQTQLTNEPLGGRNHLVNKAAFFLATLAARGWIGEDRIEDELMATTRAAGWDNERKTQDTVRRAIHAGLKEPHPDLDEHAAERAAAVMELNKNHALVLAGDKAAVLKETSDYEFRLLTVTAFGQWLANRFVTVGDGDDVKRTPLAKFWLGHAQRRQYDNLVFRPGQEVPGAYNLWRGFAVRPVKGDCSKFLAHLR